MALSSHPPVAGPLHPLVHAAVVLLFSVAVLVTAGYGFGINDSANYIPLVWQRVEPGLYDGDVMFREILNSPWNLHTAFFSTIMGALGRVIPLEWVFFGGHLLSLWVFFLAVWAIGCAIGGPVVGYVGLATLGFNRIVGDVVMLLPDELVPRSAAVAMAMLAVALAVRWQRFRAAGAAASLAVLLHPISAAMALPLVLMAPLAAEGPWRTRLREAGLVAAILVVPFLAWHLLQASPPSAGLERGLFTVVSADWQRMIDARMMGQAVNIGPWKASDWLSILVPMLYWLVALSRRETLTVADRQLGLGIAATLVIGAAGAVAADVFRLSLFTQMMLIRVVFLPVVVGTLYGVWWLIAQWRASDALERVLSLVALAALMLAATSVSVLTLILLLFLQVARRDPGLQFAARGLALSWLALAVPIATVNSWYPASATVARPDLLVFGTPPLFSVFLVAVLLGVAACVGRRWPGRGVPMLAAVVIVAPLVLFGAVHRHLGPTGVLNKLHAGVQTPWRLGNTPWREVAYWVRQYTPPGSRFLVPVNEVGFRAMAKRPIAVNWKDGGLVLFSEPHARRWEALYREVSGYAALPPAEVEALARAQGCDYVVLPPSKPMGRPPVFANAEFAVYALTGGRP